MQNRLREGFKEDDFFPPAHDLPEGLSVEEFEKSYGGEKYQQIMDDINRRLDLCEGLENGSAPFEAADYVRLRREFQMVCDYLKGRGLRLSA